MKHVVIPETPGQPRLLPFYLAAEEWVARELPRDEYFFTWIVDPTVIFGRNQLIDAEVDLEYCRRHGIRTFRRRSGGGCVFADRNNI
ncbi:MAG: lipoyltransferase, partial [Muribaculaceae bacterium]|nr:lipoyltransferase [Muribaculaceae bacterium]